MEKRQFGWFSPRFQKMYGCRVFEHENGEHVRVTAVVKSSVLLPAPDDPDAYPVGRVTNFIKHEPASTASGYELPGLLSTDWMAPSISSTVRWSLYRSPVNVLSCEGVPKNIATRKRCTSLKIEGAYENVDWSDFENLRNLTFSKCENLTSLPAQLADCPALVSVMIDECRKVRHIPVEFGRGKIDLCVLYCNDYVEHLADKGRLTRAWKTYIETVRTALDEQLCKDLVNMCLALLS